MKVRLLNAGGYIGMQKVNFPIIVEAIEDESNAVRIHRDELVKNGASKLCFENRPYLFICPEFEVIS